MADMECEHCGGTDFYKESGYFFCKGCQIQSQEVREYAFEDMGVEDTRAQTKKISSEKTKHTDKITSWECYNYVLLGLTKELISLGANKELKNVVKLLWLRYLEKMGVFKPGREQLPKLQAVCSRIDAEVVYGKAEKKKRKRRKSSSSETNTATVDSASNRYEKVKRKRALIKAQYEDFSQKSQGTSSLQNETLTSLQTTSDKSSRTGVRISYNIQAARELRRLYKNKSHAQKHRRDFDNRLTCHRATYKQISSKYRRSPYILSVNKLYSILYLGLLITQDKIQLSDLLRFIKEGKLSFNNYNHFFPEDFVDKVLNFRNFSKHTTFSNGQLRFITSEMSRFLEVDFYVSRPDLVELCNRYCKELNLPKAICCCVLKLLVKTNVTMSFRKRLTRVPNYEGRILSVIIVVLKLFFALDDVTEFSLGNYAEILNKSKSLGGNMFNIIDWLKYIEYREIIMTREYFPWGFSKTINPESALSFLVTKRFPETKSTAGKDKFKQLLTKLKSKLDEPIGVEFPTTLTPFLDYSKQIKNPKYLDILQKDFSEDNLDHILKPTHFLETLNHDDQLEICHGGANENWVLEKINDTLAQFRKSRKERGKLIRVKFNFGPTEKLAEPQEVGLDPEEVKANFHAANEERFRQNLRRMKKKGYSFVEGVDFEKVREELKNEVYKKHYNPYERHWMRVQANIQYLCQKDCHAFFEKFPNNFKLVFRECMRIAEQTEQELLTEFQMTELYLVYVANYGKKNYTVLKDRTLAKCLNKSDLW